MEEALFIMLKGLLVVFTVMGLIATATWAAGKLFIKLDERDAARKKAEEEKKKAEKERKKAEKAAKKKKKAEEKARKEKEAAEQAAKEATNGSESKDSPPAEQGASEGGE